MRTDTLIALLGLGLAALLLVGLFLGAPLVRVH